MLIYPVVGKPAISDQVRDQDILYLKTTSQDRIITRVELLLGIQIIKKKKKKKKVYTIYLYMCHYLENCSIANMVSLHFAENVCQMCQTWIKRAATKLI